MIGVVANIEGIVTRLEYKEVKGNDFELIVESIPEPIDSEGKIAFLFLNRESKTLEYKYIDIEEEVPEPLQPIDGLRAEIQGLQQALAEVTLMMIGGE